jgi:hypothetical protein
MSDQNNSTEQSVDTLWNGTDISKMNKKQLRFAEKISSTKFILVLISISLAFIGLWLGKVPPNVFSEIVQWTVSAYILGNAFIQSKWGK